MNFLIIFAVCVVGLQFANGSVFITEKTEVDGILS